MIGRSRSITRARTAANGSGGERANDSRLLQTFRALSGGNLEPVANQNHGCAHVSGEGSHFQREARVTEADRTIRPEQELEGRN